VILKSIQLPKPQTDGGKPLMQVLKDRRTSREFSSKKLPLQTLSNMLWAACGINRDDGKRTVPSAMNWQEIDVYVAMAEGLYFYDAKANMLVGVLEGDIRAVTGKQPFVKDAPVNLVFVADFAKMGNVPADQKEFYAAADTGYISQNVYLYCASEGLATVVRGLVDRPMCKEAMKLRPDQKVVLAQTVGYPK
jgi:SagB-type dehydrogenase family enzyme